MTVYRLWHYIAIAAPLVLVESSAYVKLAQYLHWGYDPGLAFATALGFITLLFAAIVSLSLGLPEPIHRHIFRGGLALFAVQMLANVLLVYKFEVEGAMPVHVVTSFFNIQGDVATKVNALIQGGTLSLVSISSWSVLALMLDAEWRTQQARKAKLDELDDILKQLPDDRAA